MSIRFLIGMVQALVVPGILSFWSISAISSSCEIVSVQKLLSGHLKISGTQAEYQRAFRRHSVSGLRTTTVSIMEKGAGAGELSIRPALPKTLSTPGKLLRVS